MALLSDDEIQDRLGSLPGWERHGDAITKEFSLADFRESVVFIVRLSYLAEAANHHPDLGVRYSRVTVTLSTHSEGGVTARDVELATEIERLSGAG